jgi:DNA primase
LKTKYQELDLLELGLIKKNAEGNYYDLFRNRIIFPIRNANGKIVGFSGRLYQNIENEPKYVNSPFTSIFTKGEILYNLDRAQPAIKQMKRVVLYEGFMDVIASVRAGIKEAIASMGTALTIEQARLIKRFTENVIVCYDGDSAGFEAMQKAIKILEKEDLIVNLIILPENLDPDEYIKKYSGEQYRLYIEQNLIDPFEFRYQYLKKHADLKKTGGIERFKLAVFELLSNTSATVTELYLRKLSQDTLVDFLTIRTDFRDNQLSKAIQKTHSETKKRVTEIAIPHKYYKAEINLLHYYLESHEFRTTIQAELAGIFCYDKLNANILLNIDDLLEVNPDNSNLKDELINRYKGEEQLRVKKVLLHEGEFSNKELEDCINQMKERMLESEIKKLNDELGTLDKNMESVKYNELTNKKLSLHKRKENLWTKTKSLKK